MTKSNNKPKVAVHKFSSCDGCQLAFLNMGENLLALSALVDIIHFAEAGPLDENTPVEIAFIEGSISTPHDVQRLQRIRENANYLVTIGACATSGGLQALRNYVDAQQWTSAIYAQPQFIESLDEVTPIAQHVKVDLELWGCPVNSRQLIAAVRALLQGVTPVPEEDKLCMECKRRQIVCVLVARGEPCQGAVTKTGCGALCPAFGRECYGCYGPAENPNAAALASRLHGLGLLPANIARRFLYIHSSRPELAVTGQAWQDKDVNE